MTNHSGINEYGTDLCQASTTTNNAHGVAIRALVRVSTFDRLQAEAAACEAFRRSQDSRAWSSTMSGGRPPRRRTLEGSHFQEARLKRNKSLGGSGARRREKTEHSSMQSGLTKSSPGVVAARNAESNQFGIHQSLPSTSIDTVPRFPRRPSTVTAHGSPTPRRKPVPASQAAPTPSHSTHVPQFSYEDDPVGEKLSVVTLARDTHDAECPSRANHIGELNARTTASPIVWQEKIRNRKSLLFGSVQKLRKHSSSAYDAQSWVHDRTVPPINLAEHGYALHPPFAGHEETHDNTERQPLLHKGKARQLSMAVRSRFKQLIRKTTPSSAALPPQHIPAKQAHYGGQGRSTVFEPNAVPGSFAGTRTVSDVSPHEQRSRVTSWTNSATTHNSRAQSALESQEEVSEYGMLPRTRSASGHSLRQRASFFGRSVHNKLRKPSRPDLGVSRRSQGLYTALQSMIQSSGKANGSAEQPDESLPPGIEHSVNAECPSGPQQHITERSRLTSRGPSSIRAVTPDPSRVHIQAMSPVVEIQSPTDVVSQRIATPEGVESTANGTGSTITCPSAQQVARRTQQAQNRWHDTLGADQARYTSRSTNPYELSTFERHKRPTCSSSSKESLQKTTAGTDLREVRSAFSPSIYSRASDGTPRVKTPEETARTSITITGREVRSYQISPAKLDRVVSQEPAIKASSEWRRWLSGELREFSNAFDKEDVLTAASQVYIPTSTSLAMPTNASDSSKSLPSQDDGQTEDHSSAKRDEKKAKRRPATRNRRRSSFMNDRYPTIESSRTSSRQSQQSRRTSGVLQRSAESASPTIASSAFGRHKSLADMVSTLRPQSGMSSNGKESLETDRARQHSATSPELASLTCDTRRPQSSVELRARFRSSLLENARPLGIQRKSVDIIPQPAIDDTLREVCAGPYATDATVEASSGCENTAPSRLNDGSLPALSSAEWLAGSNANGLNAEAVMAKGKTPSPGQRLAAGWLRERSSASSRHGIAFV